MPDEAGPLVALSELDSCDLISGPHSAHRQPRQPRKRGDDGKLLMSWRVPDWTLPPLTSDLRLSSQEPLEQLESRTHCPGCGKSQHYFCFTCLRWKGASALLALPQLASLPHVRLPSSIRSAFWRYHTRGVAPDAVSTVEALLWLCRCWHAGGHAGNSQGMGCEAQGRMGCGDERSGDGRERRSGGVWEKGEQMEEERGRGEMEGEVGVRCGQEGGGERQGRALDAKGRGEGNDEGDEDRERDAAEEIPDRTMQRNGVYGGAATLQRVANGGAEEPMGGGEEPAASLEEQGECGAMRGQHASDCHCFDDLLWFFAHFHRRIMHEGCDHSA
ncbi:unnamed protein product [Closterium sp. Naga37s-1]|nr:unnamed protein product [Closterium sp. Naga37s-1]